MFGAVEISGEALAPLIEAGLASYMANPGDTCATTGQCLKISYPHGVRLYG